MILLCGIPSESPLRAVIDAAERLEVEHLVLNQRSAGHIDLAHGIDGDQLKGAIGFGGEPVPLSAVKGVYVRIIDAEALPEHAPGRSLRPPSRLAIRSQLLHAALLEWLELTRCRVLNRPSAMASNMSKPFQAQLIARAGFRTPATLVTSDAAAVRAFRARHGRVIYKSTSSVRSIVQELDKERDADLDRVTALPTQFQALIEGTDVRVHVVGARIFATEIRSATLDYRYANREGEEVSLSEYDLPEDVTCRCLNLSRQLDLPLCGIDLRRTPAGEYFCFEVNPSPAFTYYQSETGQPIAEAIVEHLAGRDHPGPG